MYSDRKKYRVLGLMSGTSLDGLDIALCTFEHKKGGWRYSIEAANTMKYSRVWTERLKNAHQLKGSDLLALDHEYGAYLGAQSLRFLKSARAKIDFISSHGHTIFHQPSRKFTYQLGHGDAIHVAAGSPVVYDFRSLDVARGGQGAPLVPIGDRELFYENDVCLNLGGIANLSVERNGRREAFDICFVNMGLNYLAHLAGKAYDRDGEMASQGQVNVSLLKKLDGFYAKLKGRPSLGREQFEKSLVGLLDDKNVALSDRLRTFVESCAKEIMRAIAEKNGSTVLCTGGGTFNAFLLNTMLDHCADSISLVVPDKNIVNFKEALVFAFLGVLCVRNEVNCLRTVTGATRDSSGGVMVGF